MKNIANVLKEDYSRASALFVLVIGLVAVIGYVLSIPALYYLKSGVSTAMALHTAILFIVISSSLSCSYLLKK